MDENNYSLFAKVKIISIGEDFLKNFACDYPKFELCLATETITDEEIENLVSDCDWLFVVSDARNLDIAKKFEKLAKCFLVTNLFFFPTAKDIKISELEKDFGTVIALPEDKISELKFEKNELLSKIISSMILSIGDKTLAGLDFENVIDVMKNSGVMYAIIGEGISGSNPLEIVKKSLENPLLKCDTSKTTKTFVSFVGANEEFSMREIRETLDFIFDDYVTNTKEYESDSWGFVYQIVVDENIKGIRVLILTN